MDMNLKLTLLARIYAIYDRFMADFDRACVKFCAHCCTANVTLTTLEGYYLLDHLEHTGQPYPPASLAGPPPPGRFIPRVSINRLADICSRGDDPPEERVDLAAGPCPVLSHDACPLYAARPFGCRCMVSSTPCGASGAADMHPLILSVNHLFAQTIEHIDAQGYTGNFSDVLRFLASADHRRDYISGRLDGVPDGLVPNQPVYVLMIPPEHREAIAPLLRQLRSIQV